MRFALTCVETDLTAETVSEPPIVDAIVEVVAQDGTGEDVPPSKGGRRRKTAAPKTPRSRAKTAKPVTPRARKTVKSRAVAADSVE